MAVSLFLAASDRCACQHPPPPPQCGPRTVFRERARPSPSPSQPHSLTCIPPPQVPPTPSPSCRPEIRPEHPLPACARQQPVHAGMPAHPQPHVPTPTPTPTHRQHTPAHPPRATHSLAPRVAPLPAQHAGEGWGGGEARQGGLLEGWAGLGRRAGRGCRAALTPAPRCACACRADGGRCDHVAGAALFCFSVRLFVQSRVCCAATVFGPGLGVGRAVLPSSKSVTVGGRGAGRTCSRPGLVTVRGPCWSG